MDTRDVKKSCFEIAKSEDAAIEVNRKARATLEQSQRVLEKLRAFKAN